MTFYSVSAGKMRSDSIMREICIDYYPNAK